MLLLIFSTQNSEYCQNISSFSFYGFQLSNFLWILVVKEAHDLVWNVTLIYKLGIFETLLNV